jgi:D-beta-D-heptose 7-phosphate kinase/D-beta-D-heptose 1-phosphate adenosyltransferase
LSSLTEFIERFPSIRILVIGDVILDHYIFGDVSRISPEAPVPVVEVKEESFRLGGAANTVANIRSLGGQVDVVSVIGRDENGSRLRKMLQEIGASADGLLCDNGRPTIIKTRVIARHQQVVRIDREVKDAVDGHLKEEIIRIAEATLPKIDAVICSDYDKGVLSKDILKVVLMQAKERDIPVVIDPKMQNFWYYKGATLVTPNVKEASAAYGKDIIDDTSLLDAGKTLLQRLELSALLITRGEHGMSLFEAVGGQTKVTHIPTVAKEVKSDSLIVNDPMPIFGGENIILDLQTFLAAWEIMDSWLISIGGEKDGKDSSD